MALCDAKTRSGELCQKNALTGSHRCKPHGGGSLSSKTATEARGDQSASTSVLAGCVANVREVYTRAIMWCSNYMGVSGKVAYEVNQKFVELTADPR